MPYKRTTYTTSIGGKDRVLFSIFEKTNGELIIPFRTADRHGNAYATGVEISEQRYSVHPSPNSDSFTTIKHTTNLANDTQFVNFLLTDAAKLKTGFTLLFVKRNSDVSGEKYILKEEDKRKTTVVALPPYEPDKQTLFYGMIIGPREIPFVASHPEVTPTVKHFQSFTVIVPTSICAMPSHYTSEFAHLMTLDPATATNPFDEALLRQFMRGKTAEKTLIQYANCTYDLTARFLKKMLPTLTSRDSIENVLADIAELERKIVPIFSVETILPTARTSVAVPAVPEHQNKPASD